MRAFLIAVCVLIAIAVTSGFVLRDDSQSSSRAFALQGVRLDADLIANNNGRMPPHGEHK